MNGRVRGPAVGPAAAALIAVAVLGISWAGLYAGVSGARTALLCVVAALPAAATLSPRHRPAAIAVATVVAVFAVLALALRLSPFALPSFDGAAWAAVRGLIPDGMASGSHSGLPVDPVARPELVALLDVALAVLAGSAAWQITARRRPVAGLVLVGVGLAYRWTVEPPASGAAAGALALVALIAVLALSVSDRGAGTAVRRGVGAVACGAVVVAVAAGFGSGSAPAGDGWWSWKNWEVDTSGDTTTAGLDLRQRYGKLDWPTTPRVALTVEADDPMPLRAVSLDDFDGLAFALSPARSSEALPVRDGRIVLPPDPTVADEEDVFQTITLRGARTQVVMASGRPQRVSGPLRGTADRVGDAIRLDDMLEPGDRYTVRTRVPTPTPAELVAASAYRTDEVPEGETILRAAPGAEAVHVPLWGGGARVAPSRLGAYGRVAELARQVAGDARTPYAAVNRIEAHLRRSYVYDEAPPYPTSWPEDPAAGVTGAPPPLVDFLFGSRRGFCQHFAGSMAVMLRSLGIPARVAVGYTGGRYEAEGDRWVVLDRDAHSWVEVWFPGEGWIPFDPTPGRSVPNPASVSSPDYAPTPIDIDLGGIADAAVSPPDRAPVDVPDGREEIPADPVPVSASPQERGSATWPWAVAAALLLLALVAPAGRGLRRVRGRRGGDERTRVSAAARELEMSLAPLGWAPSPSSSATERAAALRAATGVDASGLYRRAVLARYAPGPPPPGAAAAAWREGTRIRRAVRRQAPLLRRVRTTLGVPWWRSATVRR